MKYILPLLLAAVPVHADEAEVMATTIAQGASGLTFAVTIAHGDTGWDDYADGWRVELRDGTVVGERPLAHPHVDEQPFTRSLSGVNLPDGTPQIFIRTRTNVDGWSDVSWSFAVPQ